jgi:hypothetical protein
METGFKRQVERSEIPRSGNARCRPVGAMLVIAPFLLWAYANYFRRPRFYLGSSRAKLETWTTERPC